MYLCENNTSLWEWEVVEESHLVPQSSGRVNLFTFLDSFPFSYNTCVTDRQTTDNRHNLVAKARLLVQSAKNSVN